MTLLFKTFETTVKLLDNCYLIISIHHGDSHAQQHRSFFRLLFSILSTKSTSTTTHHAACNTTKCNSVLLPFCQCSVLNVVIIDIIRHVQQSPRQNSIRVFTLQARRAVIELTSAAETHRSGVTSEWLSLFFFSERR